MLQNVSSGDQITSIWVGEEACQTDNVRNAQRSCYDNGSAMTGELGWPFGKMTCSCLVRTPLECQGP